MLVTIWMWTQEWSLISIRTTALTFETCHQRLQLLVVVDALEQPAELLVAAHRHVDLHPLDRLGRGQPRLAHRLLGDGLLDPLLGLLVEPVLVVGAIPGRYRSAAAGQATLGGPVAVEARVAPPALEQLVVRALLDDPAVLEHDDQVGVADRREAMSDHERRAAGEQPPERALDLPLGADVDRRRRLVEDQDPRVGEERARERDELPLPEREAEPRSPSSRVVALRQPRDELVGADGPRCGLDLRRGSRPGRPKAMLSATVPAKRKPSCGTIPSWRRSDCLRDVAQVVPVDLDPPSRGS